MDYLNYLKYIFYGLVQGFTEFLPISSTAHLKILSLLFGFDDPGISLSAIIQLGSVLAIFFYFSHDIKNFLIEADENLLSSLFKNKINKSIIIGTSSILIIGFFVKFYIPNFFNNYLRSNLSIGIISILMAFLLLLANKSFDNNISLKNHSYKNSFFIGLSQAFAIIPGVSRSGITISTALLLGWKRIDAAKFSFLLGIPAILISSLVELYYSANSYSELKILPLIIGLITAFISSLISIKILLRYLPSNGLKFFAYYRIAFGLVIVFSYL